MLSAARRWVESVWQVAPLRQADAPLLLAVLTLISIGVLMVLSASIGYSTDGWGTGFHYFGRHLVYLSISGVAAFVVLQIPLHYWYRYAGVLLVLAGLLLVAVLIPGIGQRVNGSSRWLPLGPFTLQVSEVAKLAMIVFVAAYLHRHQAALQTQWQSFAKPLAILAMFGLLLLMEPDFGSTVVIGATVLGMLFLAGVRLWQFLLSVSAGLAAGWVLIRTSDYRYERFKSFMDPWADKDDSGYQLIQSLIAFGRGEWFGVGLGNSVQKLFYLPESHTDFVFAIYAEEFGFLGVCVIVGLLTLMVTRVFLIGRLAIERRDWFVAHLVFGAGILLAGQAFVNLGVTSGLLPTKGLTLPFVSYGGSSLVVCSVIVALVIRAGLEMQGRVGVAPPPEVEHGR